MAMLPSIPEIAKRTDVLKEIDNGIQGSELVGTIQDSIPKEVGKIYRDNIDGKNYRCIVGGNWTTNTTANFEACNVVDNLSKLQNLHQFVSLIHVDKPEISKSYNYNYPANKFLFIVIRTVAGPFPNFETGGDCNDYVVPSCHFGYLYYNSFLGPGALHLHNERFTTPNVTAQLQGYASGIRIFGFIKIK